MKQSTFVRPGFNSLRIGCLPTVWLLVIASHMISEVYILTCYVEQDIPDERNDKRGPERSGANTAPLGSRHERSADDFLASLEAYLK